jgi:predicted transcriptional regulator
MTDAVEIAHSITVEAIRAGVNRPAEILDLFQSLIDRAKGSSPAPATIGRVEEDIRPQPEIEEEVVRPPPEVAEEEEARPEPVTEPEPQPAAARAPLPSKAWREPKLTPPPPPDEAPAAHLSPEDIAASHGHEFIKCLECGQTKQQLRNHLNKMHNLSVEDYRAKWGLPDDYPLIAPATRLRFQERGRRNYAQALAAGKGIAARPGPQAKKKTA